MFYKKGRVYWVDLPLDQNSHIQGNLRPCVVVNTGWGRTNPAIITVCPLTTKLDGFAFHPKCYVRDRPGQILCEQITTVDVSKIGDFIGILNPIEMAAFDKTLSLMFGINNETI